MYPMLVPVWGQKKVSDSLAMELQKVVICHVGTGNISGPLQEEKVLLMLSHHSSPICQVYVLVSQWQSSRLCLRHDCAHGEVLEQAVACTQGVTSAFPTNFHTALALSAAPSNWVSDRNVFPEGKEAIGT